MSLDAAFFTALHFIMKILTKIAFLVASLKVQMNASIHKKRTLIHLRLLKWFYDYSFQIQAVCKMLLLK